mmetsp:Transcript_9684/g.23623  ORF Transcript_9684/g.23623 Transcript_9684/m.23623 type:complete len:603 (+) Transcript_9684:2495-4303(+)
MAQLLSVVLVDARLPMCLTHLALARAHPRVPRVGFASATLCQLPVPRLRVAHAPRARRFRVPAPLLKTPRGKPGTVDPIGLARHLGVLALAVAFIPLDPLHAHPNGRGEVLPVRPPTAELSGVAPALLHIGLLPSVRLVVCSVPLGPVVGRIGGDVLGATHVARGLVRRDFCLRVVAERPPLTEPVVLPGVRFAGVGFCPGILGVRAEGVGEAGVSGPRLGDVVQAAAGPAPVSALPLVGGWTPRPALCQTAGLVLRIVDKALGDLAQLPAVGTVTLCAEVGTLCRQALRLRDISVPRAVRALLVPLAQGLVAASELLVCPPAVVGARHRHPAPSVLEAEEIAARVVCHRLGTPGVVPREDVPVLPALAGSVACIVIIHRPEIVQLALLIGGRVGAIHSLQLVGADRAPRPPVPLGVRAALGLSRDAVPCVDELEPPLLALAAVGSAGAVEITIAVVGVGEVLALGPRVHAAQRTSSRPVVVLRPRPVCQPGHVRVGGTQGCTLGGRVGGGVDPLCVLAQVPLVSSGALRLGRGDHARSIVGRVARAIGLGRVLEDRNRECRWARGFRDVELSAEVVDEDLVHVVDRARHERLLEIPPGLRA